MKDLGLTKGLLDSVTGVMRDTSKSVAEHSKVAAEQLNVKYAKTTARPLSVEDTRTAAMESRAPNKRIFDSIGQVYAKSMAEENAQAKTEAAAIQKAYGKLGSAKPIAESKKTDVVINPMHSETLKSRKAKAQADVSDETILDGEAIDEAEGTTPKTAREKDLAAKAEPKDKITHADVMKARGVQKEGFAEMDAWLKQRKAEQGTGKFEKKKISTGTVYTKKPEKEKKEVDESTIVEGGQTVGKEQSVHSSLRKMDVPAYLRKQKGEKPLTVADVKGPRPDSISHKDNLAKLRNEEVEKLDELSKSTLGSYVKKATGEVRAQSNISRDYDARSKNATNPTEKSATAAQSNKHMVKSWKREDGIGKAVSRLTREGVELVSEGVKGVSSLSGEPIHITDAASRRDVEKSIHQHLTTTHNYSKEEASDIINGMHERHADEGTSHLESAGKGAEYESTTKDKYAKDMAEHLHNQHQQDLRDTKPEDRKYPVREEVAINELKKSTLGSYINKAKHSVASAAYRLGAKQEQGDTANKFANRLVGMNKAVKRLTKEETEEVTEATHILSGATEFMKKHAKAALEKVGAKISKITHDEDSGTSEYHVSHNQRGRVLHASKELEKKGKESYGGLVTNEAMRPGFDWEAAAKRTKEMKEKGYERGDAPYTWKKIKPEDKKDTKKTNEQVELEEAEAKSAKDRAKEIYQSKMRNAKTPTERAEAKDDYEHFMKTTNEEAGFSGPHKVNLPGHPEHGKVVHVVGTAKDMIGTKMVKHSDGKMSQIRPEHLTPVKEEVTLSTEELARIEALAKQFDSKE